jgi:hypothetical protein
MQAGMQPKAGPVPLEARTADVVKLVDTLS